jgi:hypothetical protein
MKGPIYPSIHPSIHPSFLPSYGRQGKLIKDKAHLTESGLEDIRLIKAVMNRGRNYLYLEKDLCKKKDR